MSLFRTEIISRKPRNARVTKAGARTEETAMDGETERIVRATPEQDRVVWWHAGGMRTVGAGSGSSEVHGGRAKLRFAPLMETARRMRGSQPRPVNLHAPAIVAFPFNLPCGYGGR